MLRSYILYINLALCLHIPKYIDSSTKLCSLHLLLKIRGSGCDNSDISTISASWMLLTGPYTEDLEVFWVSWNYVVKQCWMILCRYLFLISLHILGNFWTVLPRVLHCHRISFKILNNLMRTRSKVYKLILPWKKWLLLSKVWITNPRRVVSD